MLVPYDHIAAIVSLRKECKSVKGTAGKRKIRIIEEHKSNEKRIDSKVGYPAV
jgi:hypothetical protein